MANGKESRFPYCVVRSEFFPLEFWLHLRFPAILLPDLIAEKRPVIHSAGMAETQAPPPLPKSQPSFGRRDSTIITLLAVGALVLVLLIPLAMITGVLRDRLQRRNAAVADITSTWGREQNLIVPVLAIPYQYTFKAAKEMPAPD